MSNKEYEEMIKLYLRLKHLLDKYNEYFDYTTPVEDPPIIIPGEIYDDICDEMGTNEIGLMGIS